MKTLFVLGAWLLLHEPETSLLVVDKNLKKPLEATSQYTLQHYLQKSFPVYAAEKEALIAATDKLVKWMDKDQPCYSADTLGTGHTQLVLTTDCQDHRLFSVMLTTRIDETQTAYSFAVVTREENKRRAQQQLLDLAVYLDQ